MTDATTPSPSSCSSGDSSADSPPEVNSISISEKCAVCGKLAFCYNYGVLTCNSCKMFFRRIEVDKISYACKCSDKCNQRKSDKPSKCKACRFKRCLLAGMKYIPPGKPEHHQIENKREDNLRSLISNLLFLDARRRHKFLNYFTTEDPTLGEMMRRPRGSRMVVKTAKHQVGIHEWSFLGIYTSIEFFLGLEFMEQLDVRDKTILIHSFAVKSMLFNSAKRTVDDKRDTILTPDLKDVYPDSLYSLISMDFLQQIRSLLVGKLIELNITNEEFVLVNVVLFCNSALSNLSEDAQKLISTRQQTYTSALLQHCLLNYQQSGPSRFSDLLSLCHVINRNFEDVHYLTVLFQFYFPSLTLKKLYTDLLESLE